MAERSKRRRLTDVLNFPIPLGIPQSYPAPATIDDKRNWKGFCEVESEPVCFHYIEVFLHDTDILVGLLQCNAQRFRR